MRAHENRNKHKLGKPLEICQKILIENHQIELGKSKNYKNLDVVQTQWQIWLQM